MHTSALRTRWAAVGAAVAITLGAGGIGLVSATSPDGAVTYVPIEPCRAADTRPGPENTGPRSTPLGAAETHVVNSNDGDCAGDVPATATGLQTNVTAVNATEPTFVTIWATGPRPLASSLNPFPGEPPAPNAVTTGITGAGDFNVYNNVGNVDIIVDIVGFYTEHMHTGADIEDGSLTGADVQDGSLSSSDTSNEAGVASSFQDSGTTYNDATIKRAAAVSLRAPSDGYVIVHATGTFTGTSAAEDSVWCQLGKGDVATSLNILGTTEPWLALTDRDTNTVEGFATHRVFEVAAADNPLLAQFGQNFGLDCLRIGGSGTIDDIHVSATFVPTSYAPSGFIFIPTL